MKRAVAIVCLGLWSFSATAFAAGSKSSGNITIVDDLTTGSAGSVNLSGGAFQVSGSFGQLGTTRASGGASTVDIGFFPGAAPGPAAPTGFTGTASGTTQIGWTWNDNANNETGYRVLSGTVNISGDLAANTTTWIQTGLSTNTLYGPFFAQAFNAAAAADSNTASRTTLAAAPENLAGNAVSSTTISLAWSANGNPGGTVYELQRSTGGPFGFLSTGTATAFTDAGLTPLTTYQYQVRAFNGDAIATAFSNQVSTMTAPPVASSATVRAVITSPKDGKRIGGNSVNVVANLILGTPAQTRDVLFQYKSSTSSVWVSIIPVRDTSANPDPSPPYSVQWNTSLLTPGNYSLRAVATSVSSTTDPSPPAISITFAPAGPRAAAAADLSQVRVYPMPYKPNGGDPDHGARFDPGDPNSGIIFDNLTQQTTIKIYTAAGQLVISFDSNAPTGRIQWDARNGSGRDVATGFYIAVITSPGQPARTKRMLIIR